MPGRRRVAIRLVAAVAPVIAAVVSSGLPPAAARDLEPFRPVPAAFEQAHDQAIELLDEDRHSESRNLLFGLIEETDDPALRRYLAGLVTATFFDSGDHAAGLDYICELYRYEPPGVHRYRHAIHAHIRVYALQTSRSAAERLIRRLRERCGRPDFTEVWIGIDLVAMRLLEQSRTYVYFRDASGPSEKVDADYLTELVARDPTAPFMDHALYFLGRFDEALARFPDSLIADTILLAAAQQAPWPASIQYYRAYVDRFPSGPRIETALSELQSAYTETERLQEALETRLLLASYQRDLPGNDEIVTAFFERVRGTLVQPLEDGRLQQVLGTYLDSLDYIRGEGLEVPRYLQLETEILRGLVARAGSGDPQALFDLALAVRDTADGENFEDIAFQDPLRLRDLRTRYSLYRLSSGLMLRLAEAHPDHRLADRALYVAGSNLRKRGAYKDAELVFTRLVRDHPDSHLADDAMAEVGYMKMVAGDWDTAKLVLLAVERTYPERNAADNAINWVALKYFQEGAYLEALDYYLKLSRMVMSDRLRRLGLARSRDIEQYAAGAERGWHLQGVQLWPKSRPNREGVVVEGLDPGGPAERLGLRERDRILAVQGEAVGSAFELQAALSDPDRRDFTLLVSRAVEHVRIGPDQGLYEGITVRDGGGWPPIEVARLAETNPLYRAGMRPGDRIRAVNGRWVSTLEELNAAVAAAFAEGEIDFRIDREERDRVELVYRR